MRSDIAESIYTNGEHIKVRLHGYITRYPGYLVCYHQGCTLLNLALAFARCGCFFRKMISVQMEQCINVKFLVRSRNFVKNCHWNLCLLKKCTEMSVDHACKVLISFNDLRMKVIADDPHPGQPWFQKWMQI